MKEDKLKEAFSRIKEDILSLGNEISEIREQLLESNKLMKQINEEIIQLKLAKMQEKTEKTLKIHEKTIQKTSTDNQKTSTHPVTSTQTSTDAQEIQGLNTPNLPISIGNQGVSTDRQTDRQTVRHIQQSPISQEKPQIEVPNLPQEQEKQELVVPKPTEEEIEEQKTTEKPIQQQITEASDLLDSLDAIKKEIRRKFKKITRQEMLVFSTIYAMEEQTGSVDYKKIALKLSLSQSSIRDYVQRMIEKGIPITKEKLNNKKIILHISPELKKIATLGTIIQLREI